MKKFRVLSLLSVLAFIMLFTACGGEKKAAEEKKAEPLEIKVSYIFKENEPTHIAMKEATDAINQRLEGQVKFVLFPNGQLPVYKDGLQQVVRGADFIDVDDLSYIGDYVPEFTALAGPMLYQNYDEYVKLMHSDLVTDLKKKTREEVINILNSKGLNVSFDGTEGVVMIQDPVPGQIVDTGNVVKVTIKKELAEGH